MTRKHFEMFAEYAKEVGLTEGQVRILADLLKTQNPRFDRVRFFQAAGIPA